MLDELRTTVVTVLLGGLLCSLGLLEAQLVLRPQDLKHKYLASWGLVTGASCGIGLLVARRLADQGVNVVLVALDDGALTKTIATLQSEFPAVQFRVCGVNLSLTHGEFMPAIERACDGLSVNLVFCNAGFMVPGLVLGTSIDAHERQIHCNVLSSVAIAHCFATRMVRERRRGLIAFTSSASAFFPGPTACTYAATKAFLTSFATSLCAELRPRGIDVVVVHPSPIQSAFFAAHDAHAPNLQSIALVRRVASAPDAVVDRLFANAGRLVYADQGGLTFIFRTAGRFLDPGVVAELMAGASRWTSDLRLLWSRYDAQR
jgi:short-subunit dehydrogenase